MLVIWNDRWHDVILYFKWSGRLLAGEALYTEVPFEYPPLVAPVLLLPRLLTSTLVTYGGAFALFVWLFDLAQKVMVYRASAPQQRRAAVLLHGVLGLMLYFTYLKRYDVVAATCATLAVALAVRRPSSLGAWVAWGLGVGLKVYPAFLAPALVWHAWREKVPLRRQLLQVTAGGITVLVPLSVAWCMAGPSSLSWLAYHSERGVQIGAAYSALSLLWGGLGQPMRVSSSFGALHLDSAWAQAMGPLSTIIMVASVASTYMLMLWRQQALTGPRGLWRLCTAVLLALLCTSKVFSPQYVSWLLGVGVVAVMAGPVDWPLGIGLVLIVALTGELWPGEYLISDGLVHKQLALVCRAVLTAGLWGYVVAGPRSPAAWRHLARRAAPALAAVLVTLAAGYILRWPDPRLFLDIRGDNVQTAAFIKTLGDAGWYGFNPWLGGPGGVNLWNYPIMDNAHFFCLKLLLMTGLAPVTAMNLYHLATFPITAALATWVLQRLGARPWAAVVAAIGYALLPYHFIRGTSHLFLGAYYMVPVALLILLGLLDLGPAVRPLGRRKGLVVAWLMPAFGAYYALFFAMLVVLAPGLWGIAQRQWSVVRRGLELGAAVILGVVCSLMPHWLERALHPSGVHLGRSWVAADMFSLRLIQLFIPPEGHQWRVLQRVAQRYARAAMINESASVALGVVGSVVFIVVMVASWVTLWSRSLPEGSIAARLRQLLLVNLLCFAFATFGGVGTVVAFYLNPTLRSSNRIIVYIAFLSVVAAIWLGQWVWQRLPRFAAKGALGQGLLAVALLGVVLDMHDVDFFPLRKSAATEQREDATFAQALEAQLAPGARVYQLPYVAFPEGNLGPYDYVHLRPYLHTQQLTYSFGSMRGSTADAWNVATAELLHRDGAQFVEALRQRGYAGVLLARRLPNGADAAETALRATVGEPTQQSDAGAYAYFAL